MTDPFLVGTFVGTLLLGAVILVAGELATGTELPRRQDFADAHVLLREWLRDELAEDAEEIRALSVVDVARTTVETVLIVGLGFRTAVHVLLYVIAAPGREPDSVEIGFVEAVSPRPAWHRALSVVATACFVGFFAQNYPVELINSGYGPLVQTAIVAFLAANAAAAVCDPILILGEQSHKRLTSRQTNT